MDFLHRMQLFSCTVQGYFCMANQLNNTTFYSPPNNHIYYANSYDLHSTHNEVEDDYSFTNHDRELHNSGFAQYSPGYNPYSLEY